MISTLAHPDAAVQPAAPASPNTVLCVDLDGTLVRTDLLWEGVLQALKTKPWVLLQACGWLATGGRSKLKMELSSRVGIPPEGLPYHARVLSLIREARASGRTVILATASPKPWADAVAEHLGLFDRVIATDATTNCKGTAKLERIREVCGDAGFDYAGDSRADIPLWRAAKTAYFARAGARVARWGGTAYSADRVLADRPNTPRAWIKAIRVSQWVKNVLIAVPLFAAHKWHDPMALVILAVAGLAFSLCASAVYLLNDLCDLPADRQHPKKRFRPLAAGTISIPAGIAGCIGLLSVSALCAAWVGPKFAGVLAVYFVVTAAYSFYLKRRLLMDVVTLAGLYTTRIIAGGAAVDVVVSHWLLAFSMFFFLSLAFLKRHAELQQLKDKSERIAKGRSYITDDAEMVQSVGPTSGYMAVLVLCLYISSDVATSHYRHPELLWAVCPVLLYWISRLWFLAKRREITEDPVAYAVRDRVSLIVGATTVAIVIAATI